MPESLDRILLYRDAYRDSAFLMQLARRLEEEAGLEDAELLMGTEMNRELLLAAGYDPAPLAEAGPLDLVVALRARDERAFERAERLLERLLRGGAEPSSSEPGQDPPDLAELLARHPEARVVSISVPGPYASFPAWQALEAGRHVFLFSDNVPLEDELALKRAARERGLLLMGPDCGTAILGGVGLGFANRVPRGPVGLLGPSGTGLQAVSSALARAGVGISHAIGTGGRDLGPEVRGLATRQALEVLSTDPQTRALGLVAKQPDPGVRAELHPLLAALGEPVGVRWLGLPGEGERDGVFYAASLDELADFLARAVGADPPSWLEPELPAARGGRLVALLGGGSLAAELGLGLSAAGVEWSTPGEPLRPSGAWPEGHLLVDVGEDFYTRGRPHPMVDPTPRIELLERAAREPGVGVLLVDVVLGDGAHPDPAAGLAELARGLGEDAPLLVAVLVGAPADPQGLGAQRARLEAAGWRVFDSVSRAAARVGALLG